jgi:multidrug efflux system membrane fusion protein
MDERVDRPAPHTYPGPMTRETRVTRRSRLRGLIILIVLLGAAAGASWYLWPKHATQTAGNNGAPGRAGATPPQPVGAATIDKGDIRIILNELGTVTSLDTVTVLTQISGQLTQIGFQEGQVVKQGDFLAQIDPRPYQAALEQAQGTLAHDQGLLEQAKADLKRFQTLGRQDSIAQQQLDDQKYLVEQVTGTVQTDQGTVDNARLNLAYCRIVSPIDGQVGLRQVDQGNYVQTSASSALVVLTQMQPISVLFSVPEDNISDIIQQVRGGATLSVEAYDRANVKKLATGTLGTLDNQIDTTTGTVKLRALFANPDEQLYPNQFVNARLLVSTMQNTVRVPVPAVQRGEPGTYVYVINANSTVSVRPIKVGPTDGGYMAVLSGLQVGEKVVTDGTDRLRDGAPVIVPPPAQGQSKGGDGGQGQGTGQGHQHGSAPAGGTGGGGEHHHAQATSEPGQAPAPAAQSGQAPAPAAQSGQAPAPAAQSGQPASPQSQ